MTIFSRPQLRMILLGVCACLVQFQAVQATPTPPTCNGQTATIYVANGVIVGSIYAGRDYRGSLRGTASHDVIVGTDGDDDIRGRSGNDTICGGGGHDDIDAGHGNDFVLGGSGDDDIEGKHGNDVLFGNAGRDQIDGDSGNDILCGNGDDDPDLEGGRGSDEIDGGAGSDIIDGGRRDTDLCASGETVKNCELTVSAIALCATQDGGASSTSSSVSSVSSSSSESSASSVSSVSSSSTSSSVSSSSSTPSSSSSSSSSSESSSSTSSSSVSSSSSSSSVSSSSSSGGSGSGGPLGTLPGQYAGFLSRANGLPHPLPTNEWWTGGVLDTWPDTLFAWPLRVNFSAAGVRISAPETRVLFSTITHRVVDELRLIPAGGTTLGRARIQRWGDWDVTYQLRSPNHAPVADVTAIQGSPFVFVQPFTDTFHFWLSPGMRITELPCNGACGQAFVLAGRTRQYLLTMAAPGTLSNERFVVAVKPAGSLFSVAVVPKGTDPAALLPYALNLPTTQADYSVGATTVDTTFTFSQPTLMGVLPHQHQYLQSSPGSLLGTYDTIRGPVRVYAGQQFTAQFPRPPVLPTLPVLEASADLKAQLQAEISTLPPMSGDVYWAGKGLLRLAHLMQLAHEAGEPGLASTAQQALRSRLANWCTATPGEQEYYFAYDPHAGGVIAVPAAFGSEHYNDHHFHYGYYIHVAAILARYDASFVTDYGECINYLVRDIAAADRTDPKFPYLRHADVYAGHSWAHGLTKASDGNNQESTSEALQAWYALILWGRETGNQSLVELGTWLLAQEAAGTRAYWFDVENEVFPTNFRKPMISILWGGKADYATFFDSSPGAIHGIQFFPATPALLAVIDRHVVNDLIDFVARTARGIWQTSLYMAESLTDVEPIEPSDPIDPVYSRSYVAHWQSTLEALGAYQADWKPEHSCGAIFRRRGREKAIMYRFASSPTSCAFTNARTRRTARFDGLPAGWSVRDL